MKKLLILGFAAVFSSSAFANTQIPKQFHGCWNASLYGGEIQVQLNISANKIQQDADGGFYEGKVKSVKNNGNNYTVKTKGVMDGSPFARDYALKLSGKTLNVSGDKFKKCN